LFDFAVATLQSFFKRDKTQLGSAGLTVVLHTHARNLDFHPHVHVIVPAGSFNKRRGLWRHKKGLYLFKADNMVRVFRGEFVQTMAQAGYRLPPNTPKKWNANCKHVGKGDKALTYLARYLYRGVINEDNILSCRNGMVTFRYKNSTTNNTKPSPSLWSIFCGGSCNMCCLEAFDGRGITASCTATPNALCNVFS
jgi:hypothetical protein